ncbi:hypothetical protein [Bifidobacterium sp.]|jgi:hypothetical protein|uniref:hypothetical protein n=1 Tax=Bifidobacterium sp. TaxID=41200 RepID=UPI0025BA137E|nr:hypothetical protein [Bifidobacterium sp.]MCH4209903.1 hypothetical protein [Bifidobacterium sp.]MCI1225359.1 hypothetical protein [Bifidobacterium sp.]
MAAKTNPFKPTAGKMPPILIGRQAIIDDLSEYVKMLPDLRRRCHGCHCRERSGRLFSTSPNRR